MRIAIGRKQLVVSLSDIGSERLAALAALSDQQRLERAASRRAFIADRARRDIDAMLSGAARLRTP